MKLEVDIPAEAIEAIAARAAEMVLSANADDDGYLDVDGAARYLACGRDRIYHLHASGQLPAQRDGRRLLFERHELRAFVENGGGTRK